MKNIGKLDALLAALAILALLRWQGWFPFNGFLDRLTGRGKAGQTSQIALQPTQNAPTHVKLAQLASPLGKRPSSR